jgi:ComF family protein
MRSLLHLLKYEGLEPVARRLGAVIAGRLAGEKDLPSKMLVVPVPLFRAKRGQRGFNQAELLAEGMVAAMRRLRPEWEGRLAARVLARQRATESQAGLSLSGRQRNLRGAFFVPQAELVRGLDVLLIDDIYTTGATARACSQALKRAGAARVWVATVARAQRENARVGAAAAEEVEIPMEQDVALWDEQGAKGTLGS